VCCLLVLDSVTSTQQWIRQQKPRDFVHDVCVLRMRSAEAGGTESYRRRQSATFRAQGALDKRRWSQPRTMRASGSCYKKSMCIGTQIDT
jgi:hypothetical protein